MRVKSPLSFFFIQVVSEFCSWRIPIFSQALCHLCKMRFCMGTNPCHFGKRSQLFIKTLSPNLHPPSPHATVSPLSLLCSECTDLCTTVHFLHCIGLFPSTCACAAGARLSAANLQSSLKHSPCVLHSHLHFIVPACDVREGGAESRSLCSDSQVGPTLRSHFCFKLSFFYWTI